MIRFFRHYIPVSMLTLTLVEFILFFLISNFATGRYGVAAPQAGDLGAVAFEGLAQALQYARLVIDDEHAGGARRRGRRGGVGRGWCECRVRERGRRRGRRAPRMRSLGKWHGTGGVWLSASVAMLSPADLICATVAPPSGYILYWPVSFTTCASAVATSFSAWVALALAEATLSSWRFSSRRVAAPSTRAVPSGLHANPNTLSPLSMAITACRVVVVMESVVTSAS